jgi:hypothetical protein
MRRRFLALSLLLLPFSACHDAIPDNSTPNALLPTVALADRAAFVEKNSHLAFLLDPADKALVPRMVSVGKAPIAAVKRNATNQLLVLSSGTRGSAKDALVPAQLQTIDADATVPSAVYPLASSFDGLAQSADGGFAVLYHAAAAQDSTNTALFNPNELALVNLASPPSGNALPNPYPKSIRSFGGVPADVKFSPSFTFAGKPRTLAVVLAQNYVTILDLGNLDRTEITVPLSPDSTSSFMPRQVLFDTANSNDPTTPNVNLYIRADGSNDIFQVTLAIDLGTPAPTPPSNDFHASLSMLAAGTTPSDLALYGTGVDTRLAVVATGSRTLAIIDPRTSSTTSIPISIPATQLVVFKATSPSTPSVTIPEDRALLVDTSSGSNSVLFADLKSIETTGGIALHDYPLGASATSVVPLVDQGIAVIMFGKYTGVSALTVVDLTSRTLSPIGSGGGQAGATMIDTQSPSRVWSLDGSNGISYLNLVARDGQARLATGEVWLDQSIADVLPLGQASSDKHRYLVVDQNDPNSVGNVTFLDADNPDRTTARTAYGFLLTNYLERGNP